MLKDFAEGFRSTLSPTTRTEKTLSVPASGGGGVWSIDLKNGGMGRSGRRLIESVAGNPNLRRVINIIANSLTSTPWYLIEKTLRSGTKATKHWPLALRTCQDMRYRMKAAQVQGDAVHEHPFLDFLYRGSPLLNGASAIHLSYRYRLIKGEFFWRILAGDNGQPLNWLVVPPQWVNTMPRDGETYYQIKMGSDVQRIPEDQICWFKDAGESDPYSRGQGIGDSLGDEIDTDEYASALLRATLANRGFNDVLIGIKAPTQAQAELVEAKYNQRQRGFQNSGKALVIDTDKLEVKPITHALSELRLLELREFERKIIAETYGVPPEILGQTSNSNRAAITHAETIYARYVLQPRLTAMMIDLQTKILPLFDPEGRYLVAFESPVPEDADYRLDVMRAKPDAFTLNEWRRQAGFPEEKWGEERSGTGTEGGGATKAIPFDVVGASPRLSKDGVDISVSEINRLLERIDSTELVEKLGPMWRSQMEQIALDQWAQIGYTNGSLTLVNPLISDHLVDFGSRWIDRGGIDATTRELVGKTLADGVSRGEGINELSKRLRTQIGYLQGDGYRATLIARTEVVRSANFGRLISWETSGLPLSKRYISALTMETRASHAVLHNTVRPLNGTWTYDAGLEPFVSDTIEVPGNSSEAAHVCNCLCSSTAFDPNHSSSIEYDSAEHRALCKAFADEVESWEQETVRIMSPFYGEMEDDLVRELRRLAG